MKFNNKNNLLHLVLAPAGRRFVTALWVATFLVGCADTTDGKECTRTNHCHLQNDVATCDVGYVWENPNEEGNLRCVLSPGCRPEDDSQFCSRQGKDCGLFSAKDNCSSARTVECGVCGQDLTCGADVINVCGTGVCTPESGIEFCVRLDVECGEFTGGDNCGESRTENCGACSGELTCGGGGIPNRCGSGCEPDCSGRECGLDPVCGASCPPGCNESAGETCSVAGQCGQWCAPQERRCTADGYGYESCGPDSGDPEDNSFGPRVSCSSGVGCADGHCLRGACQPAEVMFVLDRSASMTTSGTWSWVMAALAEKLGERHHLNLFGLRQFPGDGCVAGEILNMATGNADTMMGAVDDPETSEATPIAAALRGLEVSYGDPNDSQVVFLITDGDENCETQQSAVNAAGTLYRHGIEVYVFAVNTTANRVFLDQLASAGGTDHSWLVTSQIALKDAMESAFAATHSCLCGPGQTQCHGEDQFHCDELGLNYALEQNCPLGCGGDRCVECASNEGYCESDQEYVCSADHLDFELKYSCVNGCVGNRCWMCAYDERTCENSQQYMCRSDRLDFELERSCPLGCDGATCTECTGQTRCEDNQEFVCRDDNLDFVLARDCPMGCDGDACERCDWYETRCEGSQQLTCALNRLEFVLEYDCPLGCDGISCNECTGEVKCEGGVQYSCGDDHRSFEPDHDCPLGCDGVSCATCEGQQKCEDGQVFRCRDDGLDWELRSTCELGCAGTICKEGTEKWRFSTYGEIQTPPAIGSDGTIYVGGLDNYLYAVNPDGTQKWLFNGAGMDLTAAPVIGADGTIYVGSVDFKFYAVNPNGSEKWRFTTGGSIFSAAALGADGTIYVPSDDHFLYAVNANGNAIWSFDAGNRVGAPSIAADGTIYFGAFFAGVFALDGEGNQLWNFDPGGRVWDSPAIGEDGAIYVGINDDLYAINPDGSERWHFNPTGRVHSAPTVGPDGTIYVGSSDQRLFAVNPNGTEKWQCVTYGDMFSSPTVGADGTIYVGSDDTRVFAITPGGLRKWIFDTDGFIRSSAAIAEDGTIYIGSDDRHLYAIHSASFGLADSVWPKYHQNSKNTGRKQ